MFCLPKQCTARKIVVISDKGECVTENVCTNTVQLYPIKFLGENAQAISFAKKDVQC